MTPAPRTRKEGSLGGDADGILGGVFGFLCMREDARGLVRGGVIKVSVEP